MRKIKPYKNSGSAVSSLDNGGRFYNLLTQADDGEITPAELSKVVGLFSNRQQVHLCLEMSICELEEAAEKEIVGMLSPSLKASFKKFRPSYFSPAEAAQKGKPGESAIVTGIPKHVESCADFNGFIMIPMSTGKTTTMIMVPLIDRYDVYELRSQVSDQKFMIAHARSQRKLPRVNTRFGGIIKKLQPKKGESQKHKVFLETLYYTENPQRTNKSFGR